MLVGKFRINDIAKKIDRDKSTIIRWEGEGLISKARRDSRGWRYYSLNEVNAIIKAVKHTNYFRNQENIPTPNNRAKKLSYITVGTIVLFMLYQLLGLGSQIVMAVTNATSTMYTTIAAGVLDVQNNSSSNSITGVSYSFSAQSSAANSLGAFQIDDSRGSETDGWTINLTGNDWKRGTGLVELDYNSNGTDNDNGQLCVNGGSAAIRSTAGDNTANITVGGSYSCFNETAAISQIQLADTDSVDAGDGNYWITDFTLDHFIPTQPTAGSYTTTLVITIN